MSSQERFPTDWFPFGATLVSTMTRWAHPGQSLEEWTKEAHYDLERMAGHGMTAVGVMMDWELAEPQEGKFDFRWHDPILQKAAELGLKVVLWPWEQVDPYWIPRDHPDWLWEADDGFRPPMGCWHHPAYRTAVHRFLTRVVERYRDNPAMLMWNVAIEPIYRTTLEDYIDDRNRLYCYQPATVERYRQWLQRKHQNDLNDLNRRWLMHYTSWDQVKPPRGGKHNFNSPRFFDWRMFWVDAQADYQGGKSDLVRRLDPVHPTTGNSGWYPSPIYAGLGMPKVADRFDSFGISNFPVYRGGRKSQAMNNLTYNFVYSSCRSEKPVFVHELQGGPMAHGPIFGEAPRPEDIRQWCWQTVGNGYKGIFFWAWRPHRTVTELGGFGLCNMDGSDTNRTTAAADTCRQLQAAAPILQRMECVQPRAAILYSDRSIIVNQMGNKLGGTFNCDPHAGYLHANGVEGYFEIFHRLRIPVHIMIEEQLKELIDGNLAHIQTLVIPYLPMLSADELSILEQFVRRGGLIWSDPWLAQRDDANVGRMHVPGDSLRELFGCVQGDVRPILTDNHANRRNLWRETSRIGHGSCRVNLPGKPPVELASMIHEVPLLPAEGGEVLGVFDNGAPALIRKRHVRSATYYCGSYFGITARENSIVELLEKNQQLRQANPDSAEALERGLVELFRNILAEHDILPAVEALGADQPDMETHLLTGKSEAVAVFLNYSSERLSGDWRIRLGFNVGQAVQAKDMLSNQAVKILCRHPDAVDVTIDLPRYGIAVVHVTE